MALAFKRRDFLTWLRILSLLLPRRQLLTCDAQGNSAVAIYVKVL